MLGFYDYTVWLTYISLMSATFGIIISLHGMGHPYWGIFFLMISGLCDAFDGRVARSKKDRTEIQKGYGIQIDSLSDLVAFGVLPVCIGEAMISLGPDIKGIARFRITDKTMCIILSVLSIAIFIFYVLAALIRLAYFNVTEEERQKTEGGCRKEYIGLPVTSAALIFPTLMLIQYITPFDITLGYLVVLFITGLLFISKIRVPKPGFRGIMIMVGIGVFECILLVICLFAFEHIRQ